MKNQTVQMMTPGQMKDIISAVVEGIPANMRADEAQYWIGRKKKLTAEIKAIFAAKISWQPLIADWQSFYCDVFGIEADFSNLRIPQKREGFDRLLIVVQGMTPQQLYDKCQELFPCTKWTEQNLDEITISDRSAKDGSYAIWVRNEVEADEELKNLSANKLKEKEIPGITLEERLLYELKFFKKTGKHLDINNVTLCSGSRYSDGLVSRVSWRVGKLFVRWYHPDLTHDYSRARQTVS